MFRLVRIGDVDVFVWEPSPADLPDMFDVEPVDLPEPDPDWQPGDPVHLMPGADAGIAWHFREELALITHEAWGL